MKIKRGWYDDGTGTVRWWTGRKWSKQTKEEHEATIERMKAGEKESCKWSVAEMLAYIVNIFT